MQIVAYGNQDVYLTANPQVTFFKASYLRNTNFIMESIEQSFTGDPDFGNKISCNVSRSGDLIHRIHFETTLPELPDNNVVFTAQHLAQMNSGNDLQLNLANNQTISIPICSFLTSQILFLKNF